MLMLTQDQSSVDQLCLCSYAARRPYAPFSVCVYVRSEPGFGVLISFFVWTVFSVSVRKLIPNNSDPVVKLYFKDVSPCWSRPESLEAV